MEKVEKEMSLQSKGRSNAWERVSYAFCCCLFLSRNSMFLCFYAQKNCVCGHDMRQGKLDK
jgi:hypothetical protein